LAYVAVEPSRHKALRCAEQNRSADRFASLPIVRRLCQADNTTKNFTVNFSHTFDFDNYYAVYGRLYRALATFSLTPVIYQLRLQAAPTVVQPGSVPETIVQPGSVPEFGPAALQDDHQ
jgi:hypothetical protein